MECNTNIRPMTKQDNIKPVLFISDNFPPVIGGSSTVYDQVCKNNADKVVALSSQTNTKGEQKSGISEYDKTCGYLMYRTKSLRVPPSLLATKSKLRSIISELILMLSLIYTITKLCFKHKVEIVCIGELIYGGWIVLFSRYVLRKKTILYTHGEEISQVAEGLYNKYRGVFLKAAHKIIAVSLFCKSQIVSLYQVTPDKIDIISNGVDTQRFTAGNKNHTLLKTHGIEPTDKVILSVGRLVKRKGHHNLILAMQQIIKTLPNAKLIIIGQGEEKDNLLSLVQQENLLKSVIFLHNIDDATLLDYYQSADIFTMPNITLPDGDTEGFGLVFLEANACAKPVVGGQAGGAIEAIIHNETGLLVDGYQIKEISDSIIKILNDDRLYQHLVNHAYQFAHSSTWENKSQLFSQLVVNMLNGEHQHSINPLSELTNATPKKSSKKRLHITIDFEEMFDWSNLANQDISVDGINHIENFHQRCIDNGIQPTYLVTYNVLESESAIRFLKKVYTGNNEIGIHLHPWNNPPYIEQINTFNSFQCNLPSYLEKLKIDRLIELFEEKLGFFPKIHRAGRYGCSARTLEYLMSLGITIDLSPSAGYNFNPKGGPNFKAMTNTPFWFNNPKVTSPLLCIPIPSIKFLKGPDALTKLVNHRAIKNTFLFRIINKIIPSSPVRLSPEDNSLERMKIIGTLLAKENNNDIVLSVHSTSLYSGGNEYSITPEAAEKNIENIINYALWSKEHLNTDSGTPIDYFQQYY